MNAMQAQQLQYRQRKCYAGKRKRNAGKVNAMQAMINVMQAKVDTMRDMGKLQVGGGGGAHQQHLAPAEAGGPRGHGCQRLPGTAL